jgi:hypothetical protein
MVVAWRHIVLICLLKIPEQLVLRRHESKRTNSDLIFSPHILKCRIVAILGHIHLRNSMNNV